MRWIPYEPSAAPLITRLGTLAGKIVAESWKVPNPTASARPNQAREPSGMPARFAIAATIGISSAIRPMFDGITNARA